MVVKAGLMLRENSMLLVTMRAVRRPVKLKPNLMQYFVCGHGDWNARAGSHDSDLRPARFLVVMPRSRSPGLA